MAKQLQYQSLTNIGLNGLNTQANPASLDPSYLTKAENVVIRESGRISLRKGFKQKVAPSGTAIKGIENIKTEQLKKYLLVTELLFIQLIFQILILPFLVVVLMLNIPLLVQQAIGNL